MPTTIFGGKICNELYCLAGIEILHQNLLPITICIVTNCNFYWFET